jgi:topoisomerase-4 subunit A
VNSDDKILIIQSGKLKVITPELSLILIGYGCIRKWVPKTNFCHLLRWRKERYYIKRFLVETENKEELIITEHPNSIEINGLPSGS